MWLPRLNRLIMLDSLCLTIVRLSLMVLGALQVIMVVIERCHIRPNNAPIHFASRISGQTKQDIKRKNRYVGRAKNTIVGSRSSEELAGVSISFDLLLLLNRWLRI